MKYENLNDLQAFLIVARERSFTRAAAQMGVSSSALSHTIRGLEARLGIRLLTRTTRSVSPTEAGERLLLTITPRFEDIHAELSALSELRDKPAGMIRVSTAEHGADSILWPMLSQFLVDYPDIKVEIGIDYGLIDIVANRYDAGIRLGDQVAKDMIAVRIGPDLRGVVVGSPAYFSTRAEPQMPQDLANHACIQLRLPTHGGLLVWSFENNGNVLNIKTEGPLVLNLGTHIMRAAQEGLGLAYLPEDMVADQIEQGLLVKVLDDWCAPFTGYHLYYPSRRQPLPALSALIEALRFRV